MKLAPITSTRFALPAALMMARLSATERKVWTCGWSAPGIWSLTGSAPVASSSRSNGSLSPLPSVTLRVFGSIAGDVRVEPEIDAGVLIKVLAPQRQPVLRCTAGEIILGEVRPVDRHRAVIAEHGDGAGKALAPKRLGRREAGRTAADDDEFFRRRRAAMRR